MAQIIEFPLNDIVVQMMHRCHMPMTRENYLLLAYGGHMPTEWTGEHEDQVPAGLRDASQIGRIYERLEVVGPARPPYRPFGNPPLRR
jgi:hypothetical protein